MLWWTRKRLAQQPDVKVSDFRVQSNASMQKQTTLASWSLIMMRLTFIGDIASYAQRDDDPLGQLATLADDAAEAVSTNEKRLLSWVRRNGIPRFDQALPRARYIQLATQLRH